MTPQERELIADLFDRLAQLENQPRDPDAERAIAEGLKGAPHAVYPLVQTVLVQDEALKAANARIEALESGARETSGHPGGFLDNMRDALFGRNEPQRDTQRGSVPSVRPGPQPGLAAAPAGSFGQPYGQGPFGQPYPQAPFGQSYPHAPSFLGTAAATAAGVIGGSLLLDGVRSMLGGYHHGGPFAQTFGELNSPRFDEGSPWHGGGSDQLSRDAGSNDIGGGPDYGSDRGTPQEFTESEQDDRDDLADADDSDDADSGDMDMADDGDFDGGSDGGMDTA